MAIEDNGTGPSFGPPPERPLHKPADMEKQVHGNGIPFSITHEQRDQLCEYLSTGISITAALKLCGISRGTFDEWMWKGGDSVSKSKYKLPEADAREPYATFAKMVRYAEALSEKNAVDIIRGAAITDWKAAAWLLSRRFPADWGDSKQSAAVTVETREGKASVQVYLPQNGRESTGVELVPPVQDVSEDVELEEP